MSHVMEQTNLNGLNVDEFNHTIQAIKDQPDLANFHFRATNTWINGGYNQSRIKEFYGAGQEDTTRTEPFFLEADEPSIMLSGDQAANPAEYVLHALLGCLTTTMVYHAAARGIKINSITSQIEGDIDLHGFLDLDPRVRKGFQNLRVHFTVKSDASPETLLKLSKYSAVFDTLSNPVPVSLSITTED